MSSDPLTTLVDEAATLPQDPIDAREAYWLGLVLRVGVLISGGLVLTGLTLHLVGGHGGPGSLDEALGKNAEVNRSHPSNIVDGLKDGSASAFILTGLLVLILTPTTRVLVTFILYLKQRDRIFAALAGFVLVLLILGLIGIGA